MEEGERSRASSGAARETTDLAPRRRLLRLIHDEPGITSRHAASRLGMPLTLLHYHAARLAATQEILRIRAGRHIRLFPMEWTYHVLAEDLALIQEETALRIVRTICESPGLRIADLIERTGYSQRVVYFHVKRLRDAGLVLAASGQHLGLRPDPRLFTLLLALSGQDDELP